MNFRYQAAIARALGRSSSSGTSSTRARSRCTGASTAARRWPKPRSSTRITRRRRSTWSSRSSARARQELASRVPATRNRTRRLSAHLDDDALDDPVEPGGRVPSRTSTTAPTTWTAGAVIVARGLAAKRRRRAVGRPFGDAVARMKGEQLEQLTFAPAVRPRLRSAVLADYVTLEQGTGAVHTAPGHGCRRLPHRREVRPRDLRAGRPGRALHRQREAVRRRAGVRGQSGRRSRR